MAEIGRDYLWSLLQVANRMADYLEGITPDQRDALGILAAAPRRVDDGWVAAATVRSILGLPGLASLGSTALVERSLIEIAQRQHIWCYRIADEGVDLLTRIEQREQADPILIRIRQEWKRTVQPKMRMAAKKKPPAESSQVRGEQIRTIVLGALADGPLRFRQVCEATGLRTRQVENQLAHLRSIGRVHRLNGVYSLLAQRTEGAA